MIFILTSPIILLILYSIGIQYERGGFYRILSLVLLPAWFVDVFVNVVIVSILTFDLPFKYSPWINKKEITVSDRLERFCIEIGIIGYISRKLGKLLNKIAPSKVHIRNAL